MLTSLKLVHIILPLSLSIVYIYFILLLNDYLHRSVITIAIFCILLCLYFVRIYSLFHFKPGKTKQISDYSSLAAQNLFDLKRNEQKMTNLQHMIKNTKSIKILQLRRQFIQAYQQNSYCQACQRIKPSRAYHCVKCRTCVLRRQKHSELIGNCIGQGNIKPFIQYLFIAFVISFYMIFTLIIVTVDQHHQLNDFHNVQLSFFACQQIVLSACLLLFLKEFTISYYNAKQNVTQTEKKLKIFYNCQNPFEQEYYNKIFQSTLDYIKIGRIGDYNQWLQMQEQLN